VSHTLAPNAKNIAPVSQVADSTVEISHATTGLANAYLPRQNAPRYFHCQQSTIVCFKK